MKKVIAMLICCSILLSGGISWAGDLVVKGMIAGGLVGATTSKKPVKGMLKGMALGAATGIMLEVFGCYGYPYYGSNYYYGTPYYYGPYGGYYERRESRCENGRCYYYEYELSPSSRSYSESYSGDGHYYYFYERRGW